MRKIYARSTEVINLTAQEASAFLDKHHRQGSAQGMQLIALGLLLEDELVAVATFCEPRTAVMQRQYSVELLRLAFAKGARVVGGASRLIAHFKKSYKPSDLFTYQDTTGELTTVYEHCGFTLVKQEAKKQYLVAPGKTLATATRREALGMPYATRFGPDRILGTKIGELFHEDGKRKSNRDIFLEDLGWHVEETTGDRIYEWVNPDLTFYTYKVTATDSDKYYYGVSHVKRANATVEDCLNDGCFGSGGGNTNNKFQNWKKRHKNSLIKEIVSIHRLKGDAYQEEILLIGDRYSTDRLCLNSTVGGKDGGISRGLSLNSSITFKKCKIHGEVKHTGGVCLTCSANDATEVLECAIHNFTKHRGGVCHKCSIAANFTEQNCETHGFTAFNGSSCCKCSYDKSVSEKECEVHGKTTHRFGHCLKCQVAKSFKIGDCEIHGEVTFAGAQCLKCKSSKDFVMAGCLIHGVTTHQGSTCRACVGEANYASAECEIHGEVPHLNGKCWRCIQAEVKSKKECSTHGMTLHQGPTCIRCSAGKAYSIQECSIHGKTKFQGDHCKRCESAKANTLKKCETHGMTKHKGDKCSKCVVAASITIKDCPVHGLTKHRGKTCYSCRSKRKKKSEKDNAKA